MSMHHEATVEAYRLYQLRQKQAEISTAVQRYPAAPTPTIALNVHRWRERRARWEQRRRAVS